MELLWYDIRTLDTDTMAHTVGMMDEERRRRVNDIAGEDDRRRTVAGELLARRLLAEAGYDGGSCGRCVATLIRRFRQGADFPHEIGLFLSYPPEDVKGFVDNRARSYKCAGLWKVYSDEARARRLFTRFKRCTDTYCKLWQAGATIDQLAVAG